MKKLHKLFDEIFIALEVKDYDLVDKKMDELKQIDITTLSQEEALELLDKIKALEEFMSAKKKNLVKNISNKESVKKFRF
jgi:hypothetical protein